MEEIPVCNIEFLYKLKKKLICFTRFWLLSWEVTLFDTTLKYSAHQMTIFDYCFKNNNTHDHWWIMYVLCFFVFEASTHFKGWADLRQSCSRWWAFLVIMSFIKVVLRTKEISILWMCWKKNWSVHCSFSGSITIPWRDVVSYRRLSGFIVYVIK